jgi:hypothetical protein
MLYLVFHRDTFAKSLNSSFNSKQFVRYEHSKMPFITCCVLYFGVQTQYATSLSLVPN